ncbi:DUF4838 domain-containing protein [Phocaeicola sp.]|uniref:DUF4838 domain-containing protein n=1 Tax=Phocaeicola sp. TaxID=2773926 RepID=UPI0023C84F14|nr:DUF4838 domain-containing protein [Phocaeicola sp.]MDE5676338.1 DUF4838 domain-containing protein [Phocaeicola sp.]
MRKITSFVMAITLLCGANAYAQIPVVKNGKAKARIVVTTQEKADSTAARLLQDFIQRISGTELPIVHSEVSGKAHKGDMLIGNGQENVLSKTPDGNPITDGLKEDGFRLLTGNGMLRIASGGDKGSIYGVVTLLEKYLGVSYWGENEYSLTQSSDIKLPVLNETDNPVFRYRQSQFYGLHSDPVYKLWMRLEEPSEMFAASYWVHTFDRLLPSSHYGKEHPEYYSYFDGKRHPGKASQWCLSNPEVFEIVCERIDSIFKANPNCKMISVSQNDGNFTNCQCDQCKAIDEYEGALSGSVIHFLNKLAERFPDKEFSTLAYLYTMNPPKHVKPLPNVNIMLCDIDCNREVTLRENASGREFVKAIEGWSKISRNIFVWDYGINFDNYLAPFPNFHILADNIRLFRDHGANMHFSQVAGSRGGDFAEMRTWMVSKLMWNPELDTDDLTHTFLQGYYGDAAPYLYQYIKVMEGALIGSGQRLWIYDSPVSHKHGMLKPKLMRRYTQLFDRAEKAVAHDSVCLARVQRTRLPLLYSELEIARSEKNMDMQELTDKLNYFEQQVKRFDVPTLNERSNSPVEYCDLFRSRYMPRPKRSLAEGAKVTFIDQPEKGYAELGKTVLTDGLFGGSGFVEGWVGWEGRDASFVIDLGEVKEINSIEADFLHQLGAWVLLPTKVSYEVSCDGTHYTLADTKELPEDRNPKVQFVGVRHDFAAPTAARYIKVNVTATKTCPHWHYGVGHPCWFFLDEVTVL